MNYYAWEEHFKRAVYGGTDFDYADDVDVCWFQGHSSSAKPHQSLSFINTMHDDKYLECTDAKWGDWDLEWMFIHSCLIPGFDDRGYWAWALNGVHLICGAQSTVWDSNDGEHVAELLIDSGPSDVAYTVKYSWFHGIDYYQHLTILCVIGETSECGNDYIWGQGPVCADPPVDSTYYYWTYFCL